MNNDFIKHVSLLKEISNDLEELKQHFFRFQSASDIATSGLVSMCSSKVDVILSKIDLQVHQDQVHLDELLNWADSQSEKKKEEELKVQEIIKSMKKEKGKTDAEF